MNKHDITQKLKMLGLPKEEYWIVAGGAMVLPGIKKNPAILTWGAAESWQTALKQTGISRSACLTAAEGL